MEQVQWITAECQDCERTWSEDEVMSAIGHADTHGHRVLLIPS